MLPILETANRVYGQPTWSPTQSLFMTNGKRKSYRVSFDNERGETLVGIMDWPATEPRAFAQFAHCFTCTKDLKAIVRISRGLAELGICVLRFDFTGLGESQGDFSYTNFSTQCQDVLAAANYLAMEFSGPHLLIGHSMGGTATAVSANQIANAKAVVTIASPSSTQRLAGYLESSNSEIKTKGQGTVTIGGVPYLLRSQLLDDLRKQDIPQRIGELRLPILMFHSPADQTLPYDWGLKMFESATSAKSFVTLEGADHLLVNQPDDVHFVSSMISCWSRRYLIRH